VSYRPGDFTPISAEAWVRTNAARYFSAGHFSPEEVVGQLVVEASLSGSRLVEVQHVGDWWLIRSDVDWLPPPVDEQAFESLVDFPEDGPNGVRSEFFLTQFARDVVTHSPGEDFRVVKGALGDEIAPLFSGNSFVRSWRSASKRPD
jgi:hypothetical protein